MNSNTVDVSSASRIILEKHLKQRQYLGYVKHNNEI